ncbi:uncharacterized protein LOC141602357 [Silene latifolia]|uniref:uncharacterized protein LOC141602357 n=1 Tax=Silene latifolia TaxID=37657 RepID=UPI003D78989F
MTKSGDGKDKGDGGKKTDFIPPSSPLYLHPSDSPSLTLTQTIFNGDNYEIWADAVRNGLDAKNKLGFVEGTVKKPEANTSGEDSLESVAWRQCNAMIKAWFRNVIETRLHPSITFSATVAEIWKELQERFSTGNAPRVHQLKSDLTECKQGKNMSVVEYYTQLKTIWDELANYSRVPNCTCGAAAALLKEREEEKVHQFLMGLDTTLYGHIRSNLLMEDDVTSLSRAYSLVLREERHRAVTKVKEETHEAAMAAKGPVSNTRGRGRGNAAAGKEKEQTEIEPIQCSYCEKFWHTEENCYEKHGYPSRGRGRGRRGGRGYGRGGGRNNNNTFHTANATTSTDKDNFTSEEVVQLRNLLANKSESSQKQAGPNYEDADWSG